MFLAAAGCDPFGFQDAFAVSQKAVFGARQVISTVADGANSVFAADGDGDIDVLSASFEDDKTAWHENTNGRG